MFLVSNMRGLTARCSPIHSSSEPDQRKAEFQFHTAMEDLRLDSRGVFRNNDFLLQLNGLLGPLLLGLHREGFCRRGESSVSEEADRGRETGRVCKGVKKTKRIRVNQIRGATKSTFSMSAAISEASADHLTH